MIGIQQVRPPFVQFKQIAKDDKRATMEKGYRVTKDVDMAFIMQPGAKDCVEIEAQAWLASIKLKMLEGAADAYPQEWVDGFHKKYELWKQGMDAPVNGTSVREWPLLSPAQVQNFLTIGITTIEDVAAMTEDAMTRVGMGARDLREKARGWLNGSQVSASITEENNQLKAQLAEVLSRLSELENKPKAGRKPKLKEAA